MKFKQFFSDILVVFGTVVVLAILCGLVTFGIAWAIYSYHHVVFVP